MYGSSELDVIGQNVWKRYPQLIGTPIHIAHDRCTRTGQIETLEYKSQVVDRWIRARIYPIGHRVLAYFEDVTDLVVAREQQQLSEAKFKKLFHSRIIGMFTGTLDGTYLEANDVLLAMLGYNRQDLEQGVIHRDIISAPEYRIITKRMLKQLQRLGYAEPYEKEFIRKDGERVSALVAVAKLDHDDNQCIGLVLDISQRKRLEQLKDEFVGIASHELKTPITSTKAYAQVLQKRFEQRGDIESASLVAKMDNQLDKLSRLISDLLDVTKLEAGKLRLNISTFDLSALVTEVVEQVQFTTKRHRLELRLPAQTSVEIEADRERIGQVLTNLLSNAIKYSPLADRIIVSLHHEQGKLILRVQDFGVGISVAHQRQLFERFYRVSSADQQAFSGLGLGLYISAEIIRRHHGTIEIVSRKGHGATFIVTLPCSLPNKPTPTKHSSQPS
jgi:PAS domain S-box-containing protein